MSSGWEAAGRRRRRKEEKSPSQHQSPVRPSIPSTSSREFEGSTAINSYDERPTDGGLSGVLRKGQCNPFE